MFLPSTPPLGLNRVFNKGHSIKFQEAYGLRVILGRSSYSYLEATNFINLVVVDLRKYYLFSDTNSVIAASVQSTSGQTAEIPNTR